MSGTSGTAVTIKLYMGSTSGPIISEPITAAIGNYGTYEVNWTTQICAISGSSQVLRPVSGSYSIAPGYALFGTPYANYFEGLTPYPYSLAATWSGAQTIVVTINAANTSTGIISLTIQ
jgi:hypothetical protein